jgi:hypothetical protein
MGRSGFLEGEPAVDRGLGNLPADVGDQKRQAHVDQGRHHPFGDPTPLEIEHVDAP